MGTTDAVTALPYPGDDPVSVAALAEGIQGGRGQLITLTEGIAAAQTSQHDAWRGTDADAADREVAALGTVGQAIVERLDSASTAVTTHHDDLVRIRTAIDGLREQWTSIAGKLDSLRVSQWFAPAAPSPSLPPSFTISAPTGVGPFGLKAITPAQEAQQMQAQIDAYEQSLADLQASWKTLVNDQETSASGCQSALNAAAQGDWEYRSGVGAARGDLGAAIGLDALVFDDRERGLEQASGNAIWTELSPAEQAFYSSLAQREYSYPLVLSSKSMVPQLWSDLDPMARQSLIHSQSSVIGNTDGLPADARDQANRISLDDFLHQAQADVAAAGTALPDAALSPKGDAQAAQIDSALKAAGYSEEQILAVRGAMEVRYQLDTRIPGQNLLGGTPVDLLIFDPTAFDAQGRAAIATGDVAGAANVAMLVPGMTSQVPGYLDNQTGDALNLYKEAQLRDPGSTAVVAYVGYQAPGMDIGVTSQNYSDAGAKIVAADIAGLNQMTAGDATNLTVIAHSYGSTTTATAFAEEGARADNLVLIGSPGAGRAESAADIPGVPAGHVFVGSASSDPVTTIVQQAQDPNQVALTGLQAGWHFGSEVGGHGPNTNAQVGVLGAVAGAVVAPKAQQVLQPDLGIDPAASASVRCGCTPKPRTTTSPPSRITRCTTHLVLNLSSASRRSPWAIPTPCNMQV